MSGFGVLWRIKTRKHIRSMCSVRTSTGPGRAHWPRSQETERQRMERRRLRARQWLHERRQACQARVQWSRGGRRASAPASE